MINTSHQNPARIDPAARKYLLIMYALNGLFFITPLVITPIIALILAYVKQGEWGDSVYRDHAQYIIRTFWFSLLFAAISVPLLLIFVGWITLWLVAIWFVYRSAFGAWRIWHYHGVNPNAWLELP